VKQSRAWWQERSRGFLSESARLIQNRLGDKAVKAVFICGSFAAGDETIVLETSPPILLSDVDLVVVVVSLEDLLRWAPRRAELGAACEGLMGDVLFSGKVDVGVMLAKDLAELPARPGVYDMRARGRVLGGDPKMLELIPDYTPHDIAGREALALIENRVISLIDSRIRARSRDSRDLYERLYRIGRVYTDIGAAALSIDGSYVPGYAERRDLIQRRIAEKDQLVSALVRPEIRGSMDRWTRFKLEPSIGASGSFPEPGAVDELWENAARDILFFWRQAATRLLDAQRELSNPFPMDTLAGRMHTYHGWRNHARSWRTFLSGSSVSKCVDLAFALGMGLFSTSPLDRVREEGMKLLDHRLSRGAEITVSKAPGGFPHHGGRWGQAAAELCATWNELVFGRADG
jgi:predicted nucleotidyltransferase